MKLTMSWVHVATYRIFTLCFFAAIVLGGAYFFVSNKVQDRLLEYEANTQAAQENIAEFFTLRTQKEFIEATQEKRSQLDGYFFSETSAGSFFQQIEDIAILTGGTATISSARVVAKPKDTLEVNIQMSGTLEQIYKFIALLDVAPLGASVDTFSLSRMQADIPDQERMDAWTSQITLHVFTYTISK